MKIPLLVLMLTIIGMFVVNGQSELIISENFQQWEPTEDTDDTICSKGVVVEDFNTRSMILVTEDGIAEIPVTLIKAAIAPECESRRIEDSGAAPLEGVSTGWVMLNKLNGYKLTDFEESTDTIGEFIFGPIPQIDSIRIAHSATGGNRGFRIYTSYDGIEWTRPSEDEFWDGADCQTGDVNTIGIYESDIYIKITSGFKRSDSTSQFTRLHNIDVWGIPGTLVSVDDRFDADDVCVYPVPAKDVVYVDVAADLINSEVQIIDMAGKIVTRNKISQQNSSIDVSKLKRGNYIVNITNDSKKIVKQIVLK